MKPSDVLELLPFYFNARLPIMLTGAPGVGKTDLVTAAAAALKYRLLVTHPVVEDPTDKKGLPFPSKDGESATFLPYGDLLAMLNATEPTVVFLDDLGQAPAAVQASNMQLLLARRINQHKIPDCVTFAAATNRRSDRAGVTGILEPVKSRFGAIVELEANLEDWKLWAADHSIPAEIVSFLNFKKNLFAEAWKPSQDIAAQPCPRTWAFAAEALKMKMPARLEAHALEAAVGAAAAGEFLSFLRMYRDLPDLDELLENVDHAPIPDDPATLYAIATSLAIMADVNNFAKVARYAERLADGGVGEVAVLLVRDAVRRDRSLYETKAFTKMTTTSVGRLFRGEDK